MSLPKSYFARQLQRQLGKADVPTNLGGAAAATLSPAAGDKDLTGIDGQAALEHLTNIITAHRDYATQTATYHKAADELLQTSHLLLEAGNLAKAGNYNHIANCMKAHAAAHSNFVKACGAHKAAHSSHHENVTKSVKGLAKVLGGGPGSTFASAVETEPSRLSTATKTAALSGLSKALRSAGVNVQTRVRPNAGIPSRFGKGWTGTAEAKVEKSERALRGANR